MSSQESGTSSARRLPYVAANTTPEGGMDILTWLIVGLVAGVLASMVMGGTGYGLIGDIIIGIVGAFVGGWIMRALGTGVPVGGLPGVIIVAFIGAVVLLFILRLIRGTTRSVP
ncbi:MAG TPA: GlsB/YeaQ/YmgE family stress response membrane protein [Gemmatimonadaceae bacterium]